MTWIRLTITQRLWLGLGLILALFCAADLVSLRAARVLDSTLSSLVRDGEARSAAADEMKTTLERGARAVQAYLEGRDSHQRELFKEADVGFDRALGVYRALTSTERGSALGQQAAEAYQRYKSQAEELIRSNDAQAIRLAAYEEYQRRVSVLLNAMPQVVWPAREPPPTQKIDAAKALKAGLRSRPRMLQERLGGNTVQLDRKMAAEPRDFAAALERYRALAQTHDEREWAARAARWYSGGVGQAAAIRETNLLQQRGLANLVSLRRPLEELLDNSIQPAARGELAAAMDKASGTAHRANVFITRGLLLAVILAVLVALATSRAVKAPLRALVASSRRLAEGDFSYRAPPTSRDELGELTTAFNEMADKLQTTTVSRSYMESVVNSMGEALFVISHQGSIRTVNPIAEKLLGYQPGELVGKDSRSILIAGPDALKEGADPVASRFSAELVTREGAMVPVSVSAVPMPGNANASPAFVCIAQDLRERIAAEHHQRQASVVFENTREGIMLTDAQLRIVLVNPAFVEITGYELPEVGGGLASSLWAQRHDQSFCAMVWVAIEKQGQWQGEIWMRRKGGEICPVWKNISVVRNAEGQIVNHVLVFSDITAIKSAEERLNYLAYHDPLTDLPNRLLLADRLRSAVSRALRSGMSVALLYLDLDNFKHVNDTLGHEEGDRLLQTMATRLVSCVRGKDGVARLGGDEFVLILEDVEEPRQAARVAEKVLAAVSAPVELGGLELRMRVSIGISLGPKHGRTGDELLKAADAAMYRAKRGGRGRYEFFSAELTRQAQERLTLENALRHPELMEQLVLHYQPQMSITSGRIVGVEALIRWQHPSLGLLSPHHFIAVAEEAGLIHAVGEWVLHTACAQARTWIEAGCPPIRMAVNVSAYQIRTDKIVQRVESALRETGLHPSLLELEVTEGALQTGEGASEILERLKRLGVCLALDDFGTGYSALSSLKLLPFDRLKIDRSFVQDLQHDLNDRALAKAIIAMGRSLKLEIIAEGVETPAQLAFLREEGCDEIQGYLIGAPMSAEELEARLRAEGDGALWRAQGSGARRGGR